MKQPSYQNDLREQISEGEPRIHTIAVTDRVKSDDEHDPVRIARRVAEASGKAPTVHLAGKDRDRVWLLDALATHIDAKGAVHGH